MAQKASAIVQVIKSIGAKQEVSAGVAISRLPQEEQEKLHSTLKKIDCDTVKKEKSEKQLKEEKTRAEEEGRFLGRLEEKIRINQETVQVKTRFYNSKTLQLKDTAGVGEAELVAHFNELARFVGDLSILQCLANKTQGKIIAEFKQKGLTTEGVAKKLGIPVRFTERLFTIQGFIDRFPVLTFTGYSFETLLKYKAAIEGKAAKDENFCSSLEIQPTIKFDEEEDDDLLTETTEKMEGISVD